ncbi:TetR/AcrR family transcriptional regulator [Mycobacterium sp. ITM-2016-00317]|uniref:TetR/AcrR family transcriptional regulator n=1 Tax=Mycobacterium sp. ITM-2016-00317 TaxID=2099694 RepID=UPI0037C4F8AA
MAVSTRAGSGITARQAKRLQTRERLLGAAIAEFKRAGKDEADVGAIVAAAGVAHGTFFFHFPTKEHVLLELERREEDRMAKRFATFTKTHDDLAAMLREAADLVAALERRLGVLLFKDFLALHFSPTRPPAEHGDDHPLVVLVADQIENARQRGETAADITPMNSAIYFLLGLYALLITTDESTGRTVLLDDYLVRTLRSMQ